MEVEIPKVGDSPSESNKPEPNGPERSPISETRFECDMELSETTAQLGLEDNLIEEGETGAGQELSALEEDELLKTPEHGSPAAEAVTEDSIRERKQPEVAERTEIVQEKAHIVKVRTAEKIIICIDLSIDMDDPFKMADGSKVTMLTMVKKVIRIFLNTKSSLYAKHEYALALVQDTAIWICDFTNDVRKVLAALDDSTETMPCEHLDISNLFEIILEKLAILEIPIRQEKTFPENVIRTILIYGRSKIMPTLKPNCPHWKFLQSSEHFFLDVLFIHSNQEENKAQEIFDFFCDLDLNYTSYIFEVSGNPTKLHNYMAMLLAHPLQRPVQKNIPYKLGQELNKCKEDELEKETVKDEPMQIDVKIE